MNESIDTLEDAIEFTATFNSFDAEGVANTYTGISVTLFKGGITVIDYLGGQTSRGDVYAAKWNNELSRQITFIETPTGDLLAWLQANGTPQ